MSRSRLVALTAVVSVCAGILTACASPGPPAPTMRPTTLLFEWYPGDGPKTLYLSDGAGADVHRITGEVAPGTAHVHAGWSPDGRSIVFEALDEEAPSATIWMADADGTAAHRVVACTAKPCVEVSFPAIAPDGHRLAFVQFDDAPGRAWGPSRLVEVDLRTGVRREITRTADGATAFYNPRWSSDGSTIVLQQETYPDTAETTISGSAIASIAVDSGAKRLLTDSSVFAGHPDMRRSDGEIVFDTYDLASFGDADHDSNLFTMHADGSGLRQLTHSALADGERIGLPTWTPDGRGITATIGLTPLGSDDHALNDAHPATVSYPAGRVEDLGISGANMRLRPQG